MAKRASTTTAPSMAFANNTPRWMTMAAVASACFTFGVLVVTFLQYLATAEIAAAAVNQAAAATTQAVAAAEQANTASDHLAAIIAETIKQDREVEVEAWKYWRVFSIIEAGPVQSDKTGVTFDEVKGKYLDAAQQLEGFPLDPKELQDAELSRILMFLIRDSLVFHTYDDFYIVNRSELLPGFGRTDPVTRAGYKILTLTAAQPGVYGDARMQAEIIGEFQLTVAEYRLLISTIISQRLINVDDEGSFHPTSTPPRENQ